jgi:hypothetical protein
MLLFFTGWDFRSESHLHESRTTKTREGGEREMEEKIARPAGTEDPCRGSFRVAFLLLVVVAFFILLSTSFHPVSLSLRAHSSSQVATLLPSHRPRDSLI